jgi:uncharacterized protein YbjQ (UPF0145 family)
MNDLKHIANIEEKMQNQMQVVRTFSDDTLMEFGLHKCAKIELKNVTLIHTQNIIVDFNREIKELRQGKTQKYVRNFKNEGIKNQEMEGRLKKEYARRLRMILKSE